MDCRTCQPSLLELAAGALATEAAAEARAHVRECASCGSAFDKLAAGLKFAQALETLAPPEAVSERLRAMAQAAAVERGRPAAERSRTSAWRSWLDFLSRFAMARQVGMAMITLLLVAVGLWSLPQLRRMPAARGGTIVNPDSNGEAAPSPGVRPAERLDLKVDLRAGRIRSKEEELRNQPARKTEPAPTAQGGLREPSAFPASPAAAYAPRATASGAGGIAKRSADESLANLEQPKGSSVPQSARRASSQAVPPAREGIPSGSVQLTAARTMAKQNGCRAALTTYAQAVVAGPGTAVAGEALIEMAQCKRELGEYAAARALLERAAHVPAVASRAKALLAGRSVAGPAAPAVAGPAPEP